MIARERPCTRDSWPFPSSGGCGFRRGTPRNPSGSTTHLVHTACARSRLSSECSRDRRLEALRRRPCDGPGREGLGAFPRARRRACSPRFGHGPLGRSVRRAELANSIRRSTFCAPVVLVGGRKQGTRVRGTRPLVTTGASPPPASPGLPERAHREWLVVGDGPYCETAPHPRGSRSVAMRRPPRSTSRGLPGRPGQRGSERSPAARFGRPNVWETR